MNTNAGSAVTIVVHGSVAVTAVAFAPSTLASSKPAATALAASSDPSVAINTCLYMVSPAVARWKLLVPIWHAGR